MEPVKPLLKSDKLHLTAGQNNLLESIYRSAERVSIQEIKNFKDQIAFTPTQTWIDKFEFVGLHFYLYNELPVPTYLILHYSNDPDHPLYEQPWVPQNGEQVRVAFVKEPRDSRDTFVGTYLGHDGRNHVVWVEEEEEEEDKGHDRRYLAVNHIAPAKVQITLAELLSVYASVKGLTQDGVELKPEN